MKKKGFELSINFLVALIITLVVFMFAVSFAYKFFGKSEELQAKIDQRTKAELQTLIASQGMKVAIYPTQIETTRGKTVTLGVGILNVVGSETEFDVTMACTKFISESNVIQQPCPQGIKSIIQPSIVIKNNKDGTVAGAISTNSSAPLGTYIFDITVKYGNTEYGGLQKVYVKI
jgi:hypothetical protein